MAFQTKDWRDASSSTGGGDESTPADAAAFEDLEARVTDYADDVVGYVLTPEQFGAVGNGVTNDTAAFQACIDAAYAANVVAKIKLAAKTYLLSSVPRTDRNGNHILSLTNTYGSTKALVIEGSGPAYNMDASYHDLPLQPRTVIKTNQTGLSYSATYGPPSLIGGPTEENGGFPGTPVPGGGGVYSTTAWSGPIIIRDLAVQVPVNPTLGGIDALATGGLICERVAVLAGTGGDAVAVPTAKHAFGIRWTTRWNGAATLNLHSQVYQFYAAHVFHTTDHHLSLGGQSRHNVIGIAYEDGGDGAYGSRFVYHGVQGSKYVIAGWDPVTGVIDVPYTVHMQGSYIQTEASTGAWAMTNLWKDASNMLEGKLHVHYFNGFNVSHPGNAPPTIVGGQKLEATLGRRGVASVASAASITIPPWSEVVTITGTTTITGIVASWDERRVTLNFGGACQVTDGGNLFLVGNFPGGVAAKLSLVCLAGYWHETSRSIPF